MFCRKSTVLRQRYCTRDMISHDNRLCRTPFDMLRCINDKQNQQACIGTCCLQRIPRNSLGYKALSYYMAEYARVCNQYSLRTIKSTPTIRINLRKRYRRGMEGCCFLTKSYIQCKVAHTIILLEQYILFASCNIFCEPPL
jgi:hypothetical protein